MKLVRGAAALVGLIDLAFALLFLISPDALAGKGLGIDSFVYPRWLGLCLLASAALLFLVATDAERYLPIVFLNVGARVLVVLVGLIHIAKQPLLVITVAASNGALSAILVAAIVYAVKQRREEARASEPAGKK